MPLHASAQVRAADFVTTYVRRGSGSPIVVLGPCDDGVSVWPEVLDTLATRHRLVLPEAPGPDGRFQVWLRGFLDGLGQPVVGLIAGGRFCVPALEFTLLEPERVSRLVLVPRGWAEETGLAGEIATGPRRGALPLLIVRRECPAVEASALVSRFVASPAP
jgi:hypothetical protein